jgi:hypothetical protein
MLMMKYLRYLKLFLKLLKFLDKFKNHVLNKFNEKSVQSQHVHEVRFTGNTMMTSLATRRATTSCGTMPAIDSTIDSASGEAIASY